MPVEAGTEEAYTIEIHVKSKSITNRVREKPQVPFRWPAAEQRHRPPVPAVDGIDPGGEPLVTVVVVDVDVDQTVVEQRCVLVLGADDQVGVAVPDNGADREVTSDFRHVVCGLVCVGVKFSFAVYGVELGGELVRRTRLGTAGR
ncbi:hypothetical protein GCM10009533_68750 [Saccharopolyspora spinosporotrichia]|uniref:Uncharacterized protein n=1 Tax=Saccharopolyspora erythraea TaxID=1836 RepID=A0ABP3PD30_SACER